jgi:hypothetical protein
MKKKDERLEPAGEFPNPDELMPNPRRAKKEFKAGSEEPEAEVVITQEITPETAEQTQDTDAEIRARKAAHQLELRR